MGNSIKKTWCLVDCNSFYASCEKIFRPDLTDKPVVVLSNNDGCIVAMSQEAKKLDIPRGAPFFKVEGMLKKLGATVFSSNYSLYGDISSRVMKILAGFSPEIEVYSIDEAFLILQGDSNYVRNTAVTIRKRVLDWVGVPVSIGMGRSKTLAKVGWACVEETAKKRPDGIFLLEEEKEYACLRALDVRDVWGIGIQKGKQLISKGIRSAWDLRNADEYWIKKHLSIMTLKTLWELKGRPSFDIEEEPAPKKGIIASRSFGYPVTEKKEILEAGAEYTAMAMKKLLAQNSVCSIVASTISTNPFKRNDPQYWNTSSAALPLATDYPPRIQSVVTAQLDAMFRDGYRYKKVGIFLSGIEPKGQQQLDLFQEIDPREEAILEAVKKINKKYGYLTLHCQGNREVYKWTMRRDIVSPHYTTRWSDILQISPRL